MENAVVALKKVDMSSAPSRQKMLSSCSAQMMNLGYYVDNLSGRAGKLGIMECRQLYDPFSAWQAGFVISSVV